MKGDSAGYQEDIDDDTIEIGVLVPTLDERFINTHNHAFVKIKVIKDTMVHKKGSIHIIETDSSNECTPKEAVDYLKDDEYEIIESYYGIPLIILNSVEISGDDEDYFWKAVNSAEYMDIDGIIANWLKKFEQLGIKLK